MSAETRSQLGTRVSIWLNANLDELIRSRRANRPVLQTRDPEGALCKLIDNVATYALANVAAVFDHGPHEAAKTTQA